MTMTPPPPTAPTVAAITVVAAAAEYRYVPFLKPMPAAWEHWPLLLVPLTIAIAVVHKTIKCRTMREVPREAAVITLMILAGLGAGALALAVVVRLSEVY